MVLILRSASRKQFCPYSSVVEHINGREGVASSILAQRSDDFSSTRGGIAQLVRAPAHNRQVPGSSPAPATRLW